MVQKIIKNKSAIDQNIDTLGPMELEADGGGGAETQLRLKKGKYPQHKHGELLLRVCRIRDFGDRQKGPKTSTLRKFQIKHYFFHDHFTLKT